MTKTWIASLQLAKTSSKETSLRGAKWQRSDVAIHVDGGAGRYGLLRCSLNRDCPLIGYFISCRASLAAKDWHKIPQCGREKHTMLFALARTVLVDYIYDARQD